MANTKPEREKQLAAFAELLRIARLVKNPKQLKFVVGLDIELRFNEQTDGTYSTRSRKPRYH